MASTERDPAPDLEDRPRVEGDLSRLGFFSAVALIERLTPGGARVGGSEPGSEAIRFRHDPSLAFSARDVSEVLSIEPPAGRSPGQTSYRVTTSFLGLTGGASPTPSYLSEDALSEEGRPRRDFLDLFHHRLLSLLYRELARLRPWAEQTSTLVDSWSARLLALAGVDADLGAKTDLETQQILRLLPLLTSRIRSSQGLALAIADALCADTEGAQVTIREFAGGWSDVTPAERSQLGLRNSQLGKDALLGQQVLDPAGAFEVSIGPLNREAFRALAEANGPVRRVHALIRLWLRDPLEYRIVLRLAPAQVPPLQLGTLEGSQLGCDTWLGRRMEATEVTVYPAAGSQAH